MNNIETTLGRLATLYPWAVTVLARRGLDFCCGHETTLARACAERGLDPEEVLRELQATAPEMEEAQAADRWDERPIPELVGHILERYHAPLPEELDRLAALARKVESVHGAKPDCPVGLADLLDEVRASVGSHLDKEERILFPLILEGRGSLAHMPIRVMTQEHEDHGRNLARIRSLTGDLRVPEHACASWRDLYASLARLELDLMVHIHLENSILFPRVLNE